MIDGAKLVEATHPRPEEESFSQFVTSGIGSWEQKAFLVKPNI
jgi:hypothetical protein